ncbi:MAG: HAD family phosphatase [Candidatus Bathyarchaeota archaeon]|nr:HAD family phosphatase [Candidatus Termiticorpusculum sp.]
MFEAVIFDWDGTLADTREAIVSSFQQTLKEINIITPDKYIERRMGIGAAETFREILLEAKLPVDESLVKQLVENKSQKQINLKNQIQLFPGAIDLLETLQGKTKIGLASMNSKSVIEAIVNAKGLKKYFQAIVTVEAVKYSKPHPEIFLKCAQQLDTLPSRCVVIEDSLFGVKAAIAAKMSCIAVTTGAYNRNELKQEKPDVIVTNLQQTEVLNFISR